MARVDARWPAVGGASTDKSARVYRFPWATTSTDENSPSRESTRTKEGNRHILIILFHPPPLVSHFYPWEAKTKAEKKPRRRRSPSRNRNPAKDAKGSLQPRRSRANPGSSANLDRPASTSRNAPPAARHEHAKAFPVSITGQGRPFCVRERPEEPSLCNCGRSPRSTPASEV